MSASPSVISGEFAGHYTVERELGRGATAIVYLARDTKYSRLVALKVLRQELVESLVADRFLREIQLTAQLHHPNIVPVLGSGESDKRLYVVLPYLDGGTLRTKLETQKQLSIPEVIALGTTIAAALGFAHERNLLHRDVKPENILYSSGQACLADFGIARAMVQAADDPSVTSSGWVRGTPAYMSPEQAAGDKDVDGRSDLYSLASVLYEALAGVPTFVGATPAAVLAQRLRHVPRPVRIYRPSVSPQLEAVLAKGLSTAPADRYQTAKEFVDALASAPVTWTGEQEQSTRSTSRRTRLIQGGVVGVLIGAIAIAARTTDVFSRFGADVPLDTSLIAVLPFEGPRQSPDSSRPEDMLSEGLRRWRGVNLVQAFELGGALQREGAPSPPNEGRFVRQLGAGRFVRGRVSVTGDRRHIDATLVDTRSGAQLHDVHFTVPAESAMVLAVYRRLADSLLFRSQRPQAPFDTAEANGSLPAAQMMIRAQGALRDWDLMAAESLYARALEFDRASARAAFWIAQLRAWQPEQPRDSWIALARQAASDSNMLVGAERELAPALALLGAHEYPAACKLYEQMVQRSPRGFVGWYGLASCLDADDIVLPDSTSTARWRFRSSYQQAVKAYVRAFELLPSVYQNYQGNAYSRLRNFLFTSARYRRFGRSLDTPPKYFVAGPTLSGDTVMLVPQPIEQTLAGRPAMDPAATAAALARSRGLFRQITNGWATALPKSPGAKEALGVSLEIQADPAAIDTVRSALRLSSDPFQRLRLTATLVWLQLKYGSPNDVQMLQAARRTADSVLRVVKMTGERDAGLLGRFAAMSGQCGLAAQYARESATQIRQVVIIPQAATAAAAERAVLLAMGCPLPASAASLDHIVEIAGIGNQPKAIRELVQSFLLAQVVRVTEPLDERYADALAPRDPLIATRLLVARGHSDSASRRMMAIDPIRRSAPRGDVTPDVTLPESRLLLELGDTAKAREWLDRALASSRYLPPLEAEQSIDNMVMVASFVRSLALRAEISSSPAERAHWANAVVTIWGGADPGLRPMVDKMRRMIP